MTLALRVLLGIAALLCVGGLLIMNDVTTIWSGAVAEFIAAGVDGGAGWLPQIVLHQLIVADVQLFGLRLPGVFFFLLLIGLSYWWLKPLLGNMTAMLSSWLLAASLLLPNISKMAIADPYLVATQWLGLLAMVRFLKQPKLIWRIAFYALGAVALWVHFWSSTLLIFATASFLFYFHKNGKQLLNLLPWVLPILLGILLFALDVGNWGSDGFGYDYFNANYFSFLGYNFLGILPFIGFVLAGIWESIQKFKKREELAIINLALLLGALLGQSLALQVVFCLLAAKQLQSYFVQHYPYKNIVRAGAVLHLVGAFCVVAPLLIFGFYMLGGAGFRSGISAGAVYWMCSFLGVVGLYGMNRRLVWGTALMTGLAASFLYWVQVQPLLETKLSWPKVVVEQVLEDGKTKLEVQGMVDGLDVLEAYAKMGGVEVLTGNGVLEEERVVLYEDAVYLALPNRPAADSLSGWGRDFEEFKVWLVQ